MKPMNIVRKNSYAPRRSSGFTVASYRPVNKDSAPAARAAAGGDLTHAAHPCLWLITWDPTEPVATRPLAIQKDGTWYCYGLDITRNVWELFGPSRYIRTAYDYTPYGGVTEEGDITQPVQWSSEVYDEELALVYYNYRRYNPMDGRWINRDPIAEQGGWNLYAFLGNKPTFLKDYLGLLSSEWMWIPVIQKEIPSFRNEKHDIDYNWGNTIVHIYLAWSYSLEYDSGHFEATAISMKRDTEWWTGNPAEKARGAQSTITGKISCEENGNIKYSFDPAVCDYATNLLSSSGLLLFNIKKEKKNYHLIFN